MIVTVRNLAAIILLTVLAGTANAQVHNPVTWTFDCFQIDDKTYELEFKADIDGDWHLYSQFLESDEGPIATYFDFLEIPGGHSLDGKATEHGEIHKEFDPNFDMELSFYEHEVSFKQRVKASGKAGKVGGELTFMVCNSDMCLPPEYVPFSFDLSKAKRNANAPPAEDSDKVDERASTEPAAEINTNIQLGDGGFHNDVQVHDPIKWAYATEQVSDTEFDLVFTATLDPGWHVYAQKLPSDDGAIATAFAFADNANIELKGETAEEGELHTAFDPNFDMDLSWYEGSVKFRQRITAKDDWTGVVKGELTYMVCNDQMCLPPEYVDYSFDIAAAKPAATLSEGGADKEEANSLLAVFLLGFGAGLIALLTPCVFPMIPLTVSFFTKQSKTRAAGIRNAMIYGASIIIIYTGLGVVLTAVFGVDALHALSTGVIFNLFIFALLVIFAMSFFGAFEIQLPNSWANKMDSASDRGGLVGILFMAATLAIVSFSCTGPIIGTALVESVKSGGLGPTAIMLGFSTALALPFTLFAIFPGWMNSLPQSGGWLNAVKVTLGFLELAFAFKFLSNADLVSQWHLLEREMFIAVWIACFGGMALYLFGFLRFPHDSPLERLSVPRVMLGLTATVFTLYLIPGLWGAPLKLVAAFPPPSGYAEQPYGLYQQDAIKFKIDRLEKKVDALSAGGTINTDVPGQMAAAKPFPKAEHCPKDLNCFNDYEAGLAYAKEVDKPVMIDFTGWACVNCRKMEEEVWADPAVWSRLNDEFVLISLYVDEAERLPSEEQFESEALGKRVTRLGQKWVDLEVSRYGTNAQPHYVVTDHQGNQLHESANYDPDIPKFIDWLDRGKDAYAKLVQNQTAELNKH